jgi:hypothetical protein
MAQRVIVKSFLPLRRYAAKPFCHCTIAPLSHCAFVPLAVIVRLPDYSDVPIKTKKYEENITLH